MTLELTTTLGAVTGSLLAARLSREVLAILFAVFLSYAGSTMARRSFKAEAVDPGGVDPYQVHRLPLGLCGSGAAGMISGMLGVGGGVI
jgi:hypothetical protein